MRGRREIYIAGLVGLSGLVGCCGVKFERAENEYLRQREIEEGRNYFAERAPVFTLFRFSFGFDKRDSDSRKDYEILFDGLERR